ncbi:MAG: hypothetical protein EU521_01100 [Promethearchaeota archaeon]|nr:MAG: hypothetical protein EU521_01100 [Candidatus Lokiarchaeota archaeon]
MDKLIKRNKKLYKKYKNARDLGFKSKNVYFRAKNIDCKNPDLYHEFVNSPFYEISRHSNKDAFDMFLKYKKGGFKNKKELDIAYRLGINTYEEFNRYIKEFRERAIFIQIPQKNLDIMRF